MLKPAQVVVTEGGRRSFVSRGIHRFTGSWATHAFVATFKGDGVEAWFPRVRRLNGEARLAQLEFQDRAYAVLDVPKLTLQQRWRIAAKAESYIGRFYDVGQLLLWGLTGQFWNDGDGTLICSRLVTASYWKGGNVHLFDDALLADKYPTPHPRRANVSRGYATPLDLLISRLEVVKFHPSSRIQTLDQFRR
jgi:hypothetical protein